MQQNLLNMKQPNLGQKIVELRKAQGLTQKELVEKCNLNIRTLQRIESGEVTPRSFTLKLILETLNYKNDTFSFEEDNSYNWIKKALPFRSKTSISLFSISLFVFIILSVYLFNHSSNSEFNIKNKIEANRANITNWINTKNLDAITSTFSKNACINNTICGKENIKTILKENFRNNYKIILHTIISISSNDSIAFEKYTTKYQYNGKVRHQNGITEWVLNKEKWVILNETYNE